MTANQLTAVRNYEIARNNKVLEDLRSQELRETNRHNVETEAELKRHQKETEKIAQGELAEKSRSNRAQESIGYTNARANTMNAFTNRTNATTNRLNADTNRYTATTGRLNQGVEAYKAKTSAYQTWENARHNLAVETETARYQSALNSIAEKKNAIEADKNRITEQYNRQNIDLGYGRLAVDQKNAETNRIRVYTDTGTSIINGISKAATFAY